MTATLNFRPYAHGPTVCPPAKNISCILINVRGRGVNSPYNPVKRATHSSIIPLSSYRTLPHYRHSTIQKFREAKTVRLQSADIIPRLADARTQPAGIISASADARTQSAGIISASAGARAQLAGVIPAQAGTRVQLAGVIPIPAGTRAPFRASVNGLNVSACGKEDVRKPHRNSNTWNSSIQL
jgi:hypothetical protein